MSVKSIMSEIDGLIKNAVRSCASIYGFSVEEALAKIDSNGNLIKAVKTPLEKEALAEKKKVEKEEKKRAIEAEKTERLRLKAEKEAEKIQKEAEKEAEKIQKEAEKEQKKAEKLRLKEAENIVSKEALKASKEAEKSERSSMKEEENLSKAAEKFLKKALKKAEKKVVIAETCDIVPAVPQLEDDDCFILFQNVPLMNEINSIRDVKKFKNYKKLSVGVRLARQIQDI